MRFEKIKFEMQTRFYSMTDWDFNFVDADGFVTFYGGISVGYFKIRTYLLNLTILMSFLLYMIEIILQLNFRLKFATKSYPSTQRRKVF